MTALAAFPKWDLCQFLVKKFLCCKKHCHSWLQWARQKPTTWRLRNLLGNLPGKEKKLHYSKPKKKHWVCLAHLLTPAVRAASCFKLHIWGRTPARAGEHHVPTVPPLHPWCWLASSYHLRTDTWLTATLLSWLAPRNHKNKSTFVCKTSHLKYHPKRSQERFWSFLPSMDQTFLPAQTVQHDQHDRYSCKEYNFSCFSTYLPSPSAICWHEYVL